jgi:hypothetical protein
MVLLATAAVAQTPAPPVLNAPYQCANGITYTVTVCKPFGATDQWCETIERQNGNLVTAMDSSWSSMTGRLKGCTVASAPASPPSSAPAGSGAQQTFNPPYLKEFPTVDQIMAQINGPSPLDTANRQASAMHDFGMMISALAGPRVAQQQITPDEARLITNYFNAYTNLAKTTATQPDAYVGNQDFTASLFRTFSMPTIQQLWVAANSQAPGQPGGSSAQTLPPTNDPAQIAIRRCFELGGAGLQCVGAGMSQGLKQLMGIDLSKLTSSGKSGLIMLGTYTASSGLAFDFSGGNLDIGNCGQMVRGAHNYSMSVSGAKYLITIANQPQSLLVTLGADGNAAGPAAQDITGQKVTGYNVVTNLRTGVQVSKTPIYGPITAHCSIGALKAGPDVIVDSGITSGGTGILGALGMTMSLVGGDSAPPQPTVPPGPRMTGVFKGAGGLKIQFNDGSAVIDCAQAHVMAQYDVSLQGRAAVVSVKSTGTNPFSLTVHPDGSLSGSQPVTVNGKLMTAMDDNANPIFTPTTATCNPGALAAAK